MDYLQRPKGSTLCSNQLFFFFFFFLIKRHYTLEDHYEVPSALVVAIVLCPCDILSTGASELSSAILSISISLSSAILSTGDSSHCYLPLSFLVLFLASSFGFSLVSPVLVTIINCIISFLIMRPVFHLCFVTV